MLSCDHGVGGRDGDRDRARDRSTAEPPAEPPPAEALPSGMGLEGLQLFSKRTAVFSSSICKRKSLAINVSQYESSLADGSN